MSSRLLPRPGQADRPPQAGLAGAGPGLAAALAIVVALASMLLLIAGVMVAVHSDLSKLGALARFADQQNQNAKTMLYVVCFAVILPAAVLLVPRLGDRLARGPNGDALWGLPSVLLLGLVLVLCAVRISRRLPWGEGVVTLLIATAGWWAAALALGALTLRRPLPLLRRAAAWARPLLAASAILAMLCVTNLRVLSLPHLLLASGVVAVAGLLLRGLGSGAPGAGRLGSGALGAALDAVVVVVLLLAVPDVVVFHASPAIPNAFFEPGVVQFQQDWILGPVNQLLGGGALLVNSPSSQYGVGLVYFLAAWFHLVPIGYGTFGLIDGILTALWYAGGYGVLRLAGVRRPLAAAALGLAVLVFVYNLQYPVGQLPEQGPLRFGLPMALILFTLAGARSRRPLWRAVALGVLGLASVWALEGFAYTLLCFLALTGAEPRLDPAPGAGRRMLTRLGLGVGVCLLAHLILAGGTLLATGELPHWDQYLDFLRSLLLGGREGSITYGFDRFSPGLMMGAAVLASGIGVGILLGRAAGVARRRPAHALALAGLTTYAIASFSYTDNRSSTYLLLYVGLPVLLLVTLWLDLLLSAAPRLAPGAGRAAASVCVAAAVLLLAAAWPSIGPRFSRSALAHAYPGGGLRSAIGRLRHPPPIDPRTPEGVRLLDRSVPGRRVLVVMPTGQDLSLEILMRARRANRLFIGDPNMDGFVPQVWQPVIRRQIADLRAGTRLLTDLESLSLGAYLRHHPRLDPVAHPVGQGAAQEEWVLREILRRFDLRVLVRGRYGLLVAELRPRAPLRPGHSRAG